MLFLILFNNNLKNNHAVVMSFIVNNLKHDGHVI